MSLTLEELSFMLRGGNKLLTVEQPQTKDRENVIYPLGYEEYPDKPGVRKWLINPDNPYEPLAAGFGRYILLGNCAYLEVTEDGWERCGVYEDRPQVCRDFQMSSEKCVMLRERHGVPN
jgi:Fe-S-cluster containining protein